MDKTIDMRQTKDFIDISIYGPNKHSIFGNLDQSIIKDILLHTCQDYN